MTVEAQVVKVTKVKESAYRVRQDYLAALVRGIDKLSQDEWDNLSDEVVNWHIAAVGQMDKKRPIADFPDANGDLSKSLGVEDADNANSQEEASVDDVGDAAESNQSLQMEPDSTEAEEQVEEVKEEKSRGKPKKVKEVKPKEEKPKKARSQQYENRPEPERYSKITGERDRFGITIGTKTHEAVKMYNTADGATLKQADKAIGGRHFNILGKLAKEGHRVEKLAGGYWRITHRDDLGGEKDG